MVSIVIPFRNRFDLVHEAVSSALRQTTPPLEVILVDDASEAPFAMDRYTDSKVPIRYFRNESNVGPAASRFIGVSKTRGDFVVFLDSDDLLAESYVEKQMLTMSRLKSPTFVYCFTKLFNSGGIVSDRHIPQVEVDRILPDILFRGRVWCTSSCLWNKNILAQIAPFHGYVWEDYRMDVAAALINNYVGCTPEYLCFYRVDSQEKLSIVSQGHYLNQLKSVDGILRSIWESKKTFPEFDCAIAKLTDRYLTCLIKLNGDSAFGYLAANAARVKLFPKLLSYWLSVMRFSPARIRLSGLRFARRIVRRALSTKCQ